MPILIVDDVQLYMQANDLACACVHACERVSVCVCVYACECVCVCACACACACACVCVCWRQLCS